MPQYNPRSSSTDTLLLNHQPQTASTLSPTPISDPSPTLTEDIVESGIADDPPPYRPSCLSSLPLVTNCSCVASASHGHALSDNEDCYEDPLGFSYGYDHASPTKYTNEEDSDNEDALSDWQWGLLDVVYAILYAALILGVVLNVDVMIGRWNVGSKDRSADREIWGSGNDPTNGYMSGAAFSGVGESGEVQICRILLSASSDSQFIESTYDKPPSRIYRFLTPSVLKHCRAELAALTHSDGGQAAKQSPSNADNDSPEEIEPSKTETKEGKFLNVNEDTVSVTESQKAGTIPTETELRPSIMNMPDDLAEEGRLGRVRPNYMHAGFGGPWRRGVRLG